MVLSARVTVFCVLLGLVLVVIADETKPNYKMCVPHHIFEACKTLMTKPEANANIECVPARDRMECLEKVEKREADFVAVDPEDMYVAYKMKNEDFSVFSEIRTVEESEAEFRYEGIILVKKGSPINSLSDMRGKKSCHTGYGRNVGYKIPITKLSQAGVFKQAKDTEMSPLEKEIKGLSQLFEKSCLVGTYSPNSDLDRDLKTKYSNLCALCENPTKCNYPDKFSGYDGAVRCLAENDGDVAFTKVIFVRKYFGLPIGNNPATPVEGRNPDDFEYLCADGTRRPVTGTACSWAQRPWQGYMSNADVKTRQLDRLQDRISEFYNDGKKNEDKEAAKKMWINEKNLVVKKNEPVLPGGHLEKAQYIDVIEREGTMAGTIKLCVQTEVENRKCNVLRQAAYSRDIRPEIECSIHASCIDAVHEDKADVAVVAGKDFERTQAQTLKPVLYETYGEDGSFVAVVDPEVSNDALKKLSVSFDSSNPRAVNAARFFHLKRDTLNCAKSTQIQSDNDGGVKIVKINELSKYSGKELVCPDFSRKPLTDTTDCTFEATRPTGIFVQDSISDRNLDVIVHAFTAMGDKFGHTGRIEDVFELFEEFEPGQKNVIFSDDAVKFGSVTSTKLPVEEYTFKRIMCQE